MAQPRIKKAWRHRDRETTATLSLYGIIASLHSILIGISYLLLATGFTTIIWFPKITMILAGITIVCVLMLAIWTRDIDNDRANYFEIISTPEKDWPKDFDKSEEDKNWKERNEKFKRKRTFLEFGFIGSLTINMMLLYYFIFNPSK